LIHDVVGDLGERFHLEIRQIEGIKVAIGSDRVSIFRLVRQDGVFDGCIF